MIELSEEEIGMERVMNSQKDWWDKALIVSQICVPFIIAGFGWWIQNTIQQKDNNIRLGELAAQILVQKPAKENIPIRQWAVDILKNNLNIKIDEGSRNLLIYNRRYIVDRDDNTVLNDEDILTDKPVFMENQ